MVGDGRVDVDEVHVGVLEDVLEPCVALLDLEGVADLVEAHELIEAVAATVWHEQPMKGHSEARLAERLGVSPSTVSRALRTETAHLVRADVRKAILDLAEKQNFSPNPGARMLRKGGSSTITVVVPLDENIFFSEYYGRFLAGILHAASAEQRHHRPVCHLQRQRLGDGRSGRRGDPVQQLSHQSRPRHLE